MVACCLPGRLGETMDQELISFFNEHFRTIHERFVTMDERFQTVDDRFRSMDERLSETNQQIQSLREETSLQIQSLREENNLRFDQVNTRLDRVDDRIEGLETSGRHTRVLLEGLRHETHLVAEGVFALDERLKGHKQEVVHELQDLRKFVVRPYETLDFRIGVLEGWRETKERDPIELIRERFPKKAP